jgi:uncharacterized protein YeeX (DUF496 family)
MSFRGSNDKNQFMEDDELSMKVTNFTIMLLRYADGSPLKFDMGSHAEQFFAMHLKADAQEIVNKHISKPADLSEDRDDAIARIRRELEADALKGRNARRNLAKLAEAVSDALTDEEIVKEFGEWLLANYDIDDWYLIPIATLDVKEI